MHDHPKFGSAVVASKPTRYRMELLAAACVLTLCTAHQEATAAPASTAQLASATGLFGESHSGLFAESQASSSVQTFMVTTNADSGPGSLRQAILDANSFDAAATTNASVIDFSGSIGTITLLSPLQPLNYNATKNVFLKSKLTINGSGATGTVTVNGNAAQRVFFAGGGSITIEDVNIVKGLGRGGNGTDGGGGGMGAGGGLLVNAGASVTLDSVVFSGNAATGGNGSGFNQPLYVGVGGGGGGLVGDGGHSIGGGHQAGYGGYGGGGGAEGYYLGGNGGGPGGGVGDKGGFLGNPGKLFGGGAGGGHYYGSGGMGGDFGGGGGGCLRGDGAAGGFGGGGGDGLYGGGAGGFGGGGGGADVTPGAGGFGGGNAAFSYNAFGYANYGGGGAALGGAVFVRTGGKLSLRNGGMAGGVVTAGIGGVGYFGHPGTQPGQAFGSGMFLMNGVTTLWEVDSPTKVTVADDIAGSADPRNGTGISVLEKTGSGTLTLFGNNSFGGVLLDGGLLEAATATGLGSGTVTFQPSIVSTLRLDLPANFTNTVAGFAVNDKIDLANYTYSNKETLSYSGSSTGGTLTIVDGTKTAAITLTGDYVLSNFAVKNDGHNGSYVTVVSTAAE